MTRLRYTKAGAEPVVLEVTGDPFELCNFVRARIFGGELAARDEKFEALMRARREREAASLPTREAMLCGVDISAKANQC